MTAEELVAEIRTRGGHVHRYMNGPRVFCITRNQELAADLRARGAFYFTSAAGRGEGYNTAAHTGDGVIEFDLDLTPLTRKVEGDLWEAAAQPIKQRQAA